MFILFYDDFVFVESIEDKEIKEQLQSLFPDNYYLQKMGYEELRNSKIFMKNVKDKTIKERAELAHPNNYYLQKNYYKSLSNE